jgi:hypothetical protein
LQIFAENFKFSSGELKASIYLLRQHTASLTVLGKLPMAGSAIDIMSRFDHVDAVGQQPALLPLEALDRSGLHSKATATPCGAAVACWQEKAPGGSFEHTHYNTIY